MFRPRLILASASPRRAELLRQIGIEFEILPVDIDETRRAGESMRDYVLRLALEKAQAAGVCSARPDLPVLGADTAVCLGGAILGKPADKNEALAMLAALSNREHRVFTGVAMRAAGRHVQRLSCTRVHFREISAAERETYWTTGEPSGKAGAYAIQGKAAVFITALHGSYSGVMGLPLFEAGELMKDFGIEIL